MDDGAVGHCGERGRESVLCSQRERSREADQTGKLTYVHQSKGGHWLCLNPNRSLSRRQPKHFERVTPEGVRPAIIFAHGGAPIAVCGDGNLYYASNYADASVLARLVSSLAPPSCTSVTASKRCQQRGSPASLERPKRHRRKGQIEDKRVIIR